MNNTAFIISNQDYEVVSNFDNQRMVYFTDDQDHFYLISSLYEAEMICRVLGENLFIVEVEIDSKCQLIGMPPYL